MYTHACNYTDIYIYIHTYMYIYTCMYQILQVYLKMGPLLRKPGRRWELGEGHEVALGLAPGALRKHDLARLEAGHPPELPLCQTNMEPE